LLKRPPDGSGWFAKRPLPDPTIPGPPRSPPPVYPEALPKRPPDGSGWFEKRPPPVDPEPEPKSPPPPPCLGGEAVPKRPGPPRRPPPPFGGPRSPPPPPLKILEGDNE